MWLPAAPLDPPSLADPRALRPSASLRFASDRLDASLGTAQPLVQLGDTVQVQVQLAGGGWMSFQQTGDATFALTTFDGRFGLPVQIGWDLWVAEAGWIHTSAHLADGTRMSGEHRTPITWSREELYADLSRRVGPARIEAGASALARTTPDLGRGGLHFGGDAAWRFLFVAANLSLRAEYDWDPGVQGLLGVRHVTEQGTAGHLALQLYDGPDRRGQYQGEDDRFVGLTFGFDAVRTDRPRPDR
ncbi:MAG: hypothetical protein GY913_05120 [Proteobacteria bacterium]|nr:hypothetical protein [Pseudomonadota bacterium]MCP4916282.1 hypothetical protein [Pseudomonadota bacterium]